MQEPDRDFTKMWRMQHVRYVLSSHIMGHLRGAPWDQGVRCGGGAAGSRARIRTSVERTKTACPAWLDDPGMLRRKLYLEAGPGPAERVGRARRASRGVWIRLACPASAPSAPCWPARTARWASC